MFVYFRNVTSILLDLHKYDIIQSMAQHIMLLYIVYNGMLWYFYHFVSYDYRQYIHVVKAFHLNEVVFCQGNDTHGGMHLERVEEKIQTKYDQYWLW